MDPAHRSAVVMIARVLADVPREPWCLAAVNFAQYGATVAAVRA
jgi:hypothetical protein